MPKIITQIVDKSGFQLPTGKSMTQYTIETLQSFVCIIADRNTDELDWGFLKCITNVLDKLICCTDNYERLAQEAIEDVDGKKIRLLLSFHNTRYGSLNFLDWDDAKVSETISDLISESPLLSEIKRIFDGETETDAGLKDFMPIPDNQEIVNIEDVAETFCEIRNGFLQAYPVMNTKPDITTDLPSTFHQFAVLRDNFRVKNAFVYAIEAGLMEVDGAYFKWLKKRQLLAYFCWSVGNALIPDANNVQWSVFNRMFIAKRGREYEVETNETLRRCYIDYETKTRTSKRDTPPDGWEIVDDIIEKVKN